MANPRTTVAIGLAAATVVVFVAIIAMGGALQAGLAPWPGIAVVVLAIGAFALSRGSFLVAAGLLAASGIIGIVYALVRTESLTAASFPGPIFGIIIGIPMLGLAAVEAMGALRASRS